MAALEANAEQIAVTSSRRFVNYFKPTSWLGMKGGTYVGFGGETTAKAVSDGTLSMGEYQARRGIGSTYNLFAAGYIGGAGRESLYLATGKTRPDGTPFDLNSGLREINSKGLQVGLFSAIAGNAIPFIPRTAGAELGLMCTVEVTSATGDDYRASRLRDLANEAKKQVEEAKKHKWKQSEIESNSLNFPEPVVATFRLTPNVRRATKLAPFSNVEQQCHCCSCCLRCPPSLSDLSYEEPGNRLSHQVKLASSGLRLTHLHHRHRSWCVAQNTIRKCSTINWFVTVASKPINFDRIGTASSY